MYGARVPLQHDDRFFPVRLHKFFAPPPANGSASLAFSALGGRRGRFPPPYMPAGFEPIALHGYKLRHHFMLMHWMLRVFGEGV